MSHKYSVVAKRNPLRPNDPKRFYAVSQIREDINEDQLASDIAFATSLTEGDVRNVLRNLTFQIGNRLLAGDQVTLGSLGSFFLQVSSEGADVRTEFTYHNIKKAKFRFRPGSLIRKVLQDLKFEEVLPVYLAKQTLRDLKKP